MSSNKPADTFEKDLGNLEAIVEKMENNTLSLEDSLAAFEQGVFLVKKCRKALENAEQRLKSITETDNEST